MPENDSTPLKREDKDSKYVPPRDRLLAYYHKIFPESKKEKMPKKDEKDCVACRMIGSGVCGVAAMYILVSSRRRKVLYPNKPAMQASYILVCGCLSGALISMSLMVGLNWSFSEYKECESFDDFMKKDAEVGKRMRGKISRKVKEIFSSKANIEKEEKQSVKQTES